MLYDLNQLLALVQNPSESLSVELKGWLDPKLPAHVAKIAKALLALRNQNGGMLIFGIDGNSLKVDQKNPRPVDVRATYHTDEIQLIVSRYSSEIFPIEVHFIECNGETSPVVCVPPGVKTVIATKVGLTDAGKELIKPNQVFVRTLNNNGIVSSCEPRHNDWAKVVEVCMDNREADVARFLRRHFGDQDVSGALRALKASEIDRLAELRRSSVKRLEEILKQKSVELPGLGFWDVTVIVNGGVAKLRCNQEFRNIIAIANPNITGKPLWSDSHYASSATTHSSPVGNFWESLVIQPADSEDSLARRVEYWRISPVGEMYARRFIEDDLLPEGRRVKPLTVLDFILVIWRTSEAIWVPLAFAKAMGADMERCSVDYLFTWNKLEGRSLDCWTDPHRWSYTGKAVQDSVECRVQVPLAIASTAIAPYVHQIVTPLFELFGGTDIKLPVVESVVDEIIKRRG